ncbi:MAG: acyltransferase family protein [Prevotellaceae bacterium]|nr:acyltransferase family protein [Candidatus Minthosoma caballi]
MHRQEVANNRIEYFDLAKGICILLVLWFHIKSQYNIHSCVDIYLDAIRMPLYFFLSGFFFKPYNNLTMFVGRKTSSLLIPFAFFYLTTSVLLPIVIHHTTGMNFSTGQDWHLIYAFLTYNDYPNIPLWFLWGLFVLNITFYGLQRFIRHDIIIGICCLAIGLTLGYGWEMPASLNKAFCGLPFFYMGYIFHRHNIINRIKSSHIIPGLAFLFVVIGLTKSSSIPICMLLSVVGVMLLIYISKAIGHLPFVSYVGRYSIMLLVTHEPIIRILSACHISNPMLAYLLLIVSYLGIIPFMRKYMPYVTAQRKIFDT